tara:strand:- start:63 stop:197 length:135 start_codon:yes stop_codon:yes gene_type:complete
MSKSIPMDVIKTGCKFKEPRSLSFEAPFIVQYIINKFNGEIIDE